MRLRGGNGVETEDRISQADGEKGDEAEDHGKESEWPRRRPLPTTTELTKAVVFLLSEERDPRSLGGLSTTVMLRKDTASSPSATAWMAQVMPDT